MRAATVAACGFYPYLDEPAKQEPAKQSRPRTGKEQVKDDDHATRARSRQLAHAPRS